MVSTREELIKGIMNYVPPEDMIFKVRGFSKADLEYLTLEDVNDILKEKTFNPAQRKFLLMEIAVMNRKYKKELERHFKDCKKKLQLR